MPREQILLFRIEGSGVVKRLNATWTALGKSEPAGGVSLVMTQPSRVVRQPLSVPNGSYVLEISVERAPDVNDDRANEPAQRDSVAGQAPSKVGSDVPREPSQTTYVRRVTLEGGETVVRL